MAAAYSDTPRPVRCAPLVLAAACGCGTPDESPLVSAPASPPAAPITAPAASGDRPCDSCHREQAQAWSESTHASAERGMVAGLPTPPPGVTPIGVIGASPVVQWLVPAGGGRIQVYDPAFDPVTGAPFSIHATAPSPGSWAHWTGRGMTWNTQCAACHDTGVVKAYDRVNDAFSTTFSSRGVDCAACHGDLSAHVAGAAAAPVARMDDACGSCHARRTELTGRFQPGDAFLDHFAPALVDLSEAFRPDGGVAAESFEYNAFLGSRMAAAGVRCTNCHDPHSGRLRAEGDALCATCHAGTPDHDHHGTAVATCVDCHMPVTTYMARDVRHDHAFAVPDPALRSSHGVRSACDTCHPRTTAQTEAAARDWWGPPDRPAQVRARALADARRGLRPDASLTVVRSDPHPVWRATALAWLDAWVGTAAVDDALRAGLRDADPLARFAAAGTLNRVAPGSPDVAALRADPVRAVRIEAARADRHRYAVDDPTLADYRDFLALQADQPVHLAEHAAWRLDRGDVTGAVAALRRAASWDPGDGDIARALAIALSRQGDHDGASTALGSARQVRDSADLAFAHGLALAAAGRIGEARDALTAAVDQDPAHVRAWLNLALLAHRSGDVRGALAALDQAGDAAPQDPEIPTTRAAILRDAGRISEAIAAARAALRTRPGHPPAEALLRSLTAPKGADGRSPAPR
jgi:predicted CXXCH cytochrome family protein